MGFLDTLKTAAGVASDVGSITGTAGAVLGLGKGIAGLFGKSNQQQQIAQQKELMSYQNKLAQANSLLDYQRQRQLTQDNPMLQKIGMRQAGMNTALGDGSVASAASTGSTGSPTPPPALPTDASVDSQYAQMMNNSASLLGNLSLQRAQKEYIDEQAENQRIRNLTQVQRDLADLREKVANAKGKETENSYKAMLYDAEKRYVEMNAKNRAWSLENDTYMKDLQAFYYQDMQVAQLESVRQDYINKLDTHDLNKQEKSLYEYKVREIEARIESLRASAADSRSHVGVNISAARLNNANSELTEKGLDDNLAILKSERVRKWYDAQPKDVQEIIMSSKPVRDAVYKAQNGYELDAGDWTALAGALGYEKAGALVEVVKNAVSLGKPLLVV